MTYRRGHAEPDDSYYYSPAGERRDAGRVRDLCAELSLAAHQLGELRSDLSALQPLLHVLQCSQVVQDDVHQLCHAVAAVAEASSSTLAVFSGRARAAERRDARAARR